eukprot:3067850-Karenia_brevis.AAC.1
MKLSRARRNDVMLRSRNRISTDPDEMVAYCRHRYSPSHEPAAFTSNNAHADPTGETVLRE